MKRILYSIIILLACATIFSACKKDYHCYCIYHGQVMYSQDLGKQYKNDAEDKCNENTNTVAGETWDCHVDR